MGGAWDQEISTDLVDVSQRIEELVDEVNVTLAGVKTVRTRTLEDEEVTSDVNEDRGKFEAERLQEDLAETRRRRGRAP